MAEHPGDALSALLDGELDAAEAAAVQAHVASCVACAAELDDVRTARLLLRSLPAVELPHPLTLPLRRQRQRYAIANVAASVAAGILVLVLSSSSIGPVTLRPEVAGAVDAHASTVSAMQVGGLMPRSSTRLVPEHDVPPTTAPRRSIDDLPARFGAPRELAGYSLVDAFRADGGLHLLYRRGDHGLSVFEQPGRIDWGAVPVEQGRAVRVGAHEGWIWEAAPAYGRLVVFESGGMVITVVGDARGDDVLEAAVALPRAGGSSAEEKLGRAVARALDLLGPMP